MRAAETAEARAARIVRQASLELRLAWRTLSGSEVLVVGLDRSGGNGGGVTDHLIRQLVDAGARVLFHDPGCPALGRDPATVLPVALGSVPLTAGLLESIDLVVITASGPRIDTQFLAERAELIVDACDALAGLRANARVVSTAETEPVLPVGPYTLGVRKS